jgi:2-hydroxychromene-2-carboxylate isomerase
VASVTVYFDYMSPFAYVAAEVLPAWAQRKGVTLDWQAIDLLALSNYEHGLPYSQVKRKYTVLDAVRSAEYHGVEIRIPKPHPVRSLRAERLAHLASGDDRFEPLHRALFRAAWRDQRDIGEDDVLASCIAAAGGPVDDWLAEAEQAGADARVAEATARAEAAGVFGVPSMLLGGELFWGLDALPTLEWRLAKDDTR